MLNRLRSTVRSLGWSDTLTYILAVLIARLTRHRGRLLKYYFVAQPVPPATSPVSGTSGSTHFYRADAPDAVIGQAARPESVIRQRFEQRAHCIVAERDGELVGCIWLCPQQYREDEVRCVYRWTPAASAMWDFDVYIAPRWRISRLFARLWERAHAGLRADGVRWTLSRIDAFNAGSLAAHRKLGAQPLARGWFLVLGRVQLSILSVAPFVHLTCRRNGGPRLSFDLTHLAGPAESAETAPPDTATAGRG
jgi:L-amino acid N-acyltransferase YncA